MKINLTRLVFAVIFTAIILANLFVQLNNGMIKENFSNKVIIKKINNQNLKINLTLASTCISSFIYIILIIGYIVNCIICLTLKTMLIYLIQYYN